MVRVPNWPSWWQPTQPWFLIAVNHWVCVTFSGMSVLPPNWSLSGIFQHRIPVDRRIILRRSRVVRRRRRLEIEVLPRLAVDLRRIDEAIAAHPHLVLGVGEIGHDVAALVVRHDHFCIAGRKVLRLRNDPDAGFRALGTGDHAADVVFVDRHRGLGVDSHRYGGQERGNGDGCHAGIQISRPHQILPWILRVAQPGPNVGVTCWGAKICPFARPPASEITQSRMPSAVRHAVPIVAHRGHYSDEMNGNVHVPPEAENPHLHAQEAHAQTRTTNSLLDDPCGCSYFGQPLRPVG